MEWNVVETSAPGRAGIVGNPSDMYGGSMLSCATHERARCRLEPADRMALSVGGETAEPATASDLQPAGDRVDIARAALRAFEIDPEDGPFRLEATTEIPMSAGLGGSTALLCAIVGAIEAARGRAHHPHAYVELLRSIELNHMRVLCGFQDASLAIFGGLRFVDVRGREALHQGPEEPYVVAEALVPAQFPFLCAHTGVEHHSGTVHKSLRERWEEGEKAVVDGYARIQRLAALGKRALLDRDWPRLAALMTENHAIQRDLGGSGESNERLIAAALDGGALAAKLAGAGGGGTIIALTLDSDRTRAALTAAGADRLLTPDPTAPGLTIASSL
jgi:galactokinase/mevalonate kinase-like predicted kinase